MGYTRPSAKACLKKESQKNRSWEVRPPEQPTSLHPGYYGGDIQVLGTGELCGLASKVGNSISDSTINEVLSTTQEIYDRQGRLYQVKEPAEADSTNTTTTYSYDVGNRLSRVQQATSAGTQNRWPTYDNRGFLTNEQHPENGAFGNGPVSYSNYDARGHARNKTDGPHDLTFTYDRAERLTQVTGNGGQLLKTFAYGTSNAAGVRTNGRLETATRYNYVGSPFNATAAVTETYAYGGRQGRASSRTTQMIFNGTPSETFTQSWTWNALGDLGSLSYPQCAFAGCTPVSRTVSPGYTNGFLTSVPGWAGSITYHPKGMLNQVSHANGIVDTQANDPDMMRRPSSISSAKSSVTLWSSGSYFRHRDWRGAFVFQPRPDAVRTDPGCQRAFLWGLSSRGRRRRLRCSWCFPAWPHRWCPAIAGLLGGIPG